MPTTVDVSLHDLIVFTSPLLQTALGATASISEEALSIFWEPRMILFTHTVTALEAFGLKVRQDMSRFGCGR